MDHNKLWKILQEMGISDHPPCLLRTLYAGQEETELLFTALLSHNYQPASREEAEFAPLTFPLMSVHSIHQARNSIFGISYYLVQYTVLVLNLELQNSLQKD